MLLSEIGLDGWEFDCEKNEFDSCLIEFVPAEELKEKIYCIAKAAIKIAKLREKNK